MKKTIMTLGTCAWVGAACGSSVPEDIEAYLRVLRQTNQAPLIEVMGGQDVVTGGYVKELVIKMEPDTAGYDWNVSTLAGSLVGTIDSRPYDLHYPELLPEMQEKCRALPAEVGRHLNAGYVCSQIAALEPEDVDKLKSPQCALSDVVDTAAKRFAARHKIPEALSESFAHEMSRKPLRQALESLVKSRCFFSSKVALEDLSEEALTQFLTNLFLVHEDLISGVTYRSIFLKSYLQERDFDKAANAFLRSRVGQKETPSRPLCVALRPAPLKRMTLDFNQVLAHAPLCVKLRATSLPSKSLDVREILRRVVHMEESRALAILSFLREAPHAYTPFWGVEPSLSTPYIAWLSTLTWRGDFSPLFQCGELSEERRQELDALRTIAQKRGRVKEWLVQKNASA